MKIISWNVNGIRAVLKKGFIDFIKKENPDILCLQETKTGKEVIKIDHKDYKEYWNAAEKLGYSGTAIFTKEEPLSINYGIKISEHDKEGRVITLEYKDFYLVNVYTPNSGRELLRLEYRQKWDKEFLKHVKKLEEKKPVVVCGDLNVAHTEIDLKNAKANYNKTAGYMQVEIDGFETILKSGFIDTFREFNKEPENYTYWSPMFNARARNVGWRIDYFLISKSLRPKLQEAFILSRVVGSDHCPVGLLLN